MWRKKTPKIICVFKVISGPPMGKHFKGKKVKSNITYYFGACPLGLVEYVVLD
jgi:hypothetical protein